MTRENRTHKVTMTQGKLRCACEEDIFLGIPCRHQIAIFFKFNLQFETLPFDSRWEINYFQNESEEVHLIDPIQIEVSIL